MSTPVTTAPSPDVLVGNLTALTPATRAALQAAAATVGTQLTEVQGQLCVRTRDERWVPVQASADAIGDVDRQLAAVGEEAAPLLIVVGLGVGTVLDAIERRGGATRVLAIEPVPALALAMLARRDWTGWIASKRLTLLVGPDYAGAADAWKLITRGSGTPPVIVNPLLEREFVAETARARTIAQHAIAGAASNERARQAFAGRYLLNTLANVPTVAGEGDIAALSGRFAGVPAIVVGAGPSLDRNLEGLRRLQDRALVITVDTAIRPLLAGGVRPHLAVGIDPSVLNARHLVDLPDVRGIWLAAEASLDPSVFSQFAGRTFTFQVSTHQPWPWLASVGYERGRLDAWGSVLTSAFDLAVRAGCAPLVFAGADLAYTRGLQYCRNTVYEPDWSHLETDAERAEAFYTLYLTARPHLRLPGVTGDAVLTAPHFVQFRDWLIARAGAAKRDVINATGGGILQGGTIRQADLESLDFPPLAGGHRDLRQSLHDAWRASARQRPMRPLATALASTGTLPMATWLDFGGDTASADQIAGAAGAAAVTLAAEDRIARYLAHVRDSHDQRVQTIEAAQDLSHGHYAIAARRAHAQQAHMVLDYLQRTYDVGSLPDPADINNHLQGPTRAARPLRALEVGCGAGRLMAPLVKAGIDVDGVDLSERMLHFARQTPALSASQFFVSRGDDLGAAPDGTYDLVYSQLVFRYITSRTVRNRLLHAMSRALRPGGVVLVELRFFPNATAVSVAAPHVPWSADDLETMADPLQADVRPTPDELHLLYEDFGRYFGDLRLQFVDMPPASRATLAPHLLISGSVDGRLWNRVR